MSTTPSPSFPNNSAYRRLARILDSLPHRFPPAEDESDLRLLAKLFNEPEAELASQLQLDLETPAQIAERLGRELRETAGLLKEMSKKGLITLGKTPEGRLGFGLMPFVVGIYEAQVNRIDAEMAQLFEAYYQKAFHRALIDQPQVHRVIPVRESVTNNMEVRPFESATDIVHMAQSWGVVDCICRTQKALIGKPCDHPIDVCMVLSTQPNAFDNNVTGIRVLDQEEAIQTLERAAQAGLVHCVSNNQKELWYICNCCTCSCSVLRGMAEMGIANVVAHSAFVNQVDESLCVACGACIEHCQFNALSMESVIKVDVIRCVGCGLCVPACPESALSLVRRVGEVSPPETEDAWRQERRSAHLDH